MAKVQRRFAEFDGKIRLGRFKEEATLREKRDIVLDKLKEKLPSVFEKHDEETLTSTFRDQGSYEMGTGTKPLDSDFDIDQGVYFDVAASEYDPVTLKERVHEALDGHTKSVRIRRPCVTVQYQSNGESLYHVDVAVYSSGGSNSDGRDRLAVGRRGSSEENRSWDVSDPAGLSSVVLGRFTGNDRHQFRRVVRYFKRWRDDNFSSDGNAAPNGIGLTVGTFDDLVCRYFDVVAGEPDDLSAIRDVTRGLLSRFRQVWDSEHEQPVWRLSVNLPVDPWSDVFEKMTNRQMGDFKTNLEDFLEALEFADDVVDPVAACEKLRKVFGSDFPVPARKDTGKKTSSAAVVGSSRGA